MSARARQSADLDVTVRLPRPPLDPPADNGLLMPLGALGLLVALLVAGALLW